MNKFLNLYSHFCNKLEQILNVMLAAIVSSLIIVVFLQITSRHLMPTPWIWTIDISLLLFAWSIFVAAGLGVRHNSHFEVDLWPSKWKLFSHCLTFVSIIAMMVLGYFILVQGIYYSIGAGKSFAGMTGISRTYFVLSVPVGALLILIFLVEKALILIFGKQEGGNDSCTQ